MKIIKQPKRLPRKIKKKIIKSWGKDTYRGIMKGYFILVPWVIVNKGYYEKIKI